MTKLFIALLLLVISNDSFCSARDITSNLTGVIYRVGVGKSAHGNEMT